MIKKCSLNVYRDLFTAFKLRVTLHHTEWSNLKQVRFRPLRGTRTVHRWTVHCWTVYLWPVSKRHQDSSLLDSLSLDCSLMDSLSLNCSSLDSSQPNPVLHCALPLPGNGKAKKLAFRTVKLAQNDLVKVIFVFTYKIVFI